MVEKTCIGWILKEKLIHVVQVVHVVWKRFKERQLPSTMFTVFIRLTTLGTFN